MNKSIVINLSDGSLENGFPQVTVQLRTEGYVSLETLTGSLPPTPMLTELCRQWQLMYKHLCDRQHLRSSLYLEDDELEIVESSLTNVSSVSFDKLCQQLQESMNSWLSAKEFVNSVFQLRSRLNAEDKIRVILETENQSVRRLPWHLWDFFNDYPCAEIFFYQPNEHFLSNQGKNDLFTMKHSINKRFYGNQNVFSINQLEPRQTQRIQCEIGYANPSFSESEQQKLETRFLEETGFLEPQLSYPLQYDTPKVRILVILGNIKGLDVERETKLLKNLQESEVVFLVNPTYQKLKAYLVHPAGWDILFFAGHSQTEGETGKMYINENQSFNNVTIDQLKTVFRVAIANGLKVAIFNSCDGLGFASALEKLNIYTAIVMREAVPNLVAQNFLESFLNSFVVQKLPLSLAVQQARRELEKLEDMFPGASWLPVISLNPAIETLTWRSLGRILVCTFQHLRTLPHQFLERWNCVFIECQQLVFNLLSLRSFMNYLKQLFKNTVSRISDRMT
ncbi:MAG: hypothetical protein SAK29_36750 [Scytonema sp. PMC 1069.18]|nr:hypothetical protein [Scytonema sp. PMC 1069.18]MEC4883543.1 hypothetical protein [Scytonema sp. PMC 1070.18]